MPVIDGKALASKILNQLKKEIEEQKLSPCLVIIGVGFHEPFYFYYRKIEKGAKRAGVEIKKYLFFYHTPQEKIIEKISELNKDPKISGILLQIPLPPHLKEDEIVKAINPQKDVDGFHPQNLENLIGGKRTVNPPVAQAILHILSSIKEPLTDKQVVILARSEIFAQPLECLLGKQGAKIEKIILSLPLENTLSNKKIQGKILRSDIIITALGSPALINKQFIQKESIILDLGFSRKDKKITGDFDFHGISKDVKWITPVPGGVGPVTAAMLLKNVVKAAKLKN